MKLHLIHCHRTYKTFSDRSCIRKSGKEPFKLLFDKSLKGNNFICIYNFESPNAERLIFKLNVFSFII